MNNPRQPAQAHPISIESLVRFNKNENKFIISFDGYLYIFNRLTGEKSWLYLPFKHAEIDPYGFEIIQSSIITLGEYAKKGIANLVPDDYDYSE